MPIEITPEFAKQYCVCLSELYEADKKDSIRNELIVLVVIIAVGFFSMLAACGVITSPGSLARKIGVAMASLQVILFRVHILLVSRISTFTKNYFIRKKINKILSNVQFISIPQSTADNRKLPNEIVLSIFQYLSFKDLCTVRIVSKQWNHIVNDPTLWKKRLSDVLSDEEKKAFKTKLPENPKVLIIGMYQAKREKVRLLELVKQLRWNPGDFPNYSSLKSAFIQLLRSV